MDESAALLERTVEVLFRDAMSAVEASDSPTDLWKAIEESGVGSVLVPEELGGFGGHWQDASIVLFLAGFHAVPAPLADTVLARWLLAKAGIELPLGAIAITLVDSASLERSAGGQWTLRGASVGVPWGNAVDHVVVASREATAWNIALLATGGIARTVARSTLAGDPVASLQLAHAGTLETGVVGHDVFGLAALTRVCLMAGALNGVLQQTVEHAAQRQQFGKPIARFQVIQHSLAQLASETAAVTCAAISACRAADHGEAAFEIAAAKLRANRAVSIATPIAHQIHGAIGFTEECKLQRFTRRLWCWQSEYGSERYWAARLSDLAGTIGGPNLWAHVTQLSDRI